MEYKIVQSNRPVAFCFTLHHNSLGIYIYFLSRFHREVEYYIKYYQSNPYDFAQEWIRTETSQVKLFIIFSLFRICFPSSSSFSNWKVPRSLLSVGFVRKRQGERTRGIEGKAQSPNPAPLTCNNILLPRGGRLWQSNGDQSVCFLNTSYLSVVPQKVDEEVERPWCLIMVSAAPLKSDLHDPLCN